MSLRAKLPSQFGNALVLAVAISVSGCISIRHDRIESVQHQPQTSGGYCSKAPVLPRMHFRATGFFSYAWDSPSVYGYEAAQSQINELAANCGVEAGTPSTASVDIYIVEENPSGLYAWIVGIPMFSLAGATLGLFPFIVFRDYSACLEYRVEGSGPRVFFRRAHSSEIENMWGGTNWGYRDGATQSKAKREQAISDLAAAVWNDFAVTGVGEVTDGRTCLDRLNGNFRGEK